MCKLNWEVMDLYGVLVECNSHLDLQYNVPVCEKWVYHIYYKQEYCMD